MELTQLKYFKAVAELQHFTNAAEQLHISQPSLSKAIANLEDELGTNLFERDKKSVYLNEFGKCLYKHVKKVFDQLAEAEMEIKDMNIGAHGDVRVASSFELTEPNPILENSWKFYMDHPQIHFHFYQQSTEQILNLLETRFIDFSLCTKDELNLPQIKWNHLYSEELFLLTAEGSRFSKRESVRLEELSNENFIIDKIAPGKEDSLHHLCRQAGFSPKIAFEGNSVKMTGQAVVRGYGVSFVSRTRKERVLASPRSEDWERKLLFIPIENDYSIKEIGIAHLIDKRLSAAAKLYLDNLLESFSSYTS